MIKITQNTVVKNFNVSVDFETSRDPLNVANRVANRVVHILDKIGVATETVAKNDVSVDFVSYNDVSLDDVLLLLVDDFKVGFGFGIHINTVSVTTNKDGSIIKLFHKNEHKLRDYKRVPIHFDGDLPIFQVFHDTVLIDKFDTSHVSALQSGQQVEQILQDLLNSRK